MLVEKAKLLKYKTKLLVTGIGIILLLLFLFSQKPKKVSLSQIDSSFIKEYVRTEGTVQDLYKSSGTTFFDLKNSNESIKVVAFRELSLEEGEEVEVVGKVKLYRKKLEIVLEELEK